MSNKRNVALYLDRELVEKSHELGFNLACEVLDVTNERNEIKRTIGSSDQPRDI